MTRAKATLIWAGFAVSALFAYLAVRHVHFGEVWDGLRESNYWWLVPAFVVLVAANILRGYRWQLLFASETRPPIWPVLSAMLLGQFFNNVLPARAGEAARIVALNQSAGTSRVEAAGTIVAERAWDVLSLVVMLFVAVPWLPHVTWLRAAAILGIALALGMIVIVGLLAQWAERPLTILLRPLARLPFVSVERTARATGNLVHGLAGLRRARLAFTAFALTTASWLALALMAWLVLRGFHLRLGFGAALLVFVAIGLAMILPSSPAAVGVFEAATIVALRAYHVSDSRALSYALVLHALNFFPYVTAGLLLLQAHARGVRKLGTRG